MATSYPGSLDSLTNPTASDSLGSATVPHADQHANANDAIEAIETVLGVSPAGTNTSTVGNRVARVENKLYLNTGAVETFPRQVASGTIALGSSVAKLTLFTPGEGLNVSQIQTACLTGGTDTLGTTTRRMGLFTVSGSTYTLVARTASDSTLFTSSSTIYTRSLDTTGGYPANYTLVAGTTYAVGLVAYNTGGTFGAPTMIGCGVNTILAGLTPVISVAPTITDLATFTSTNVGTTQVYFRMLP
jgi:hypothetical protein